MAAPIPPTTPYPAVPANPDVCKVEKLDVQKAQLIYDQAKTNYDRIKRLFDQGAASAAEVRAAETALANAAIALSNAKYAEAACRNNKGNDPNKVCIGLSLELNRLIDELAQRQELERIARANYDAVLQAASHGAASPEEVESAKLAWQLAQIERQKVEQKIADQRDAIAANPACRDFPSERPTPTSTTPPTTTQPTSTQPTTTPPTTQPTTPPDPSSSVIPTSGTVIAAQ